MKKRILALVLSVAMVLGAVSFTAFADMPAAATATKFFTAPSASENVTIRTENGENFVVFDGNTFKNASGDQATVNKAAATGALMDANADLTGLADSYIAIRIKINDNSAAYDHFTSYVRIYFTTTEEGQAEFRVSKDANGANAPKWLDLKDGSLVPFRTINNNNAEQGFRFVGDMDGYLLIKIAGSGKPERITDEYLKNYFNGFNFYFNHEVAASTSSQRSSWEDKEFLVGDSYIVKDAEAFQAAIVEENDIVQYAPEGGEDGAYYALRIGGFHSTSYGTHGSAVGKTWSSATSPFIQGSGSVQRTYLHYTTLPNGDRAAALKLNTDKTYTDADGNTVNFTSGGGSITFMDTYDKEWTSDSAYRAIVAGIPDAVDMTKMNAIAFRVATKDGTIDNEAFNFALEVRKNNPTVNREVVKGKMAAGEVTYFDANTGASQKLTVKEDGTIDVNGNLDGYIIVDFDNFTNDFFADPADVQANWGGHFNPTSQENAPAQYSTSAEAIGYYLNSGFANGKQLYIGDCFFLEDAQKFQRYHCTHSSYTAGTTVAPTCQAGGYTPYTCDGCGIVENRDTTAPINCDELGGDVAAKAPTCKEAGYTAAKKCSMCGEISKAAETIDPIACDKNVDYPAKAATCKEAGNEAGKKCSMCGEISEGGAPIAPIACDKLGGDLPAKAPTCKEAGYSAAKKCSMCGEISEAAETVAPIACDKNVTVEAKAATCKEAGNEAGKKCSMCGELQEGGATINPIAHDNKGGDVAGKAATCKEAGVEAAKKCSMCGEISEGGAVIDIIAHDKNVDVKEIPATCKEAGVSAGKKCSMCGEVQEGCTAVDPIAHDKTVDVAEVKATCTAEGKTAGKKCSMCGEVQEGCETIAKADHDMKLKETIAPTTTDKGYDLYKCENCDETEKKNYVDEIVEEEKEEEENQGGETEAPDAGDNLFVIVLFMVVALGATTVIFATRKRARK